ncbi:hypothetical protein AB06_4810 [Escherichia coli 2-474-04_S1_C1]|uniref:Uncharacterized protein n=1 Tax=Escherichia coli TaxID=562 RepID=A0A7T3RHR2_ECOLX|nr:hypothetical protein AB06_4810 [Escherichia coli 2-474-04_S1_C1]QQA03425.1 hypothetical protein [Escherichia coli]
MILYQASSHPDTGLSLKHQRLFRMEGSELTLLLIMQR